MKKSEKIGLFFEFLVFGIIVGTIEDLIAVKLTTGHPLDLKVIGIVVLVSFPFAFLGEIVVDRINFTQMFEEWFK